MRKRLVKKLARGRRLNRQTRRYYEKHDMWEPFYCLAKLQMPKLSKLPSIFTRK